MKDDEQLKNESNKKSFFEVERFSLEKKKTFHKMSETKKFDIETAKTEVENMHPKIISHIIKSS